MNATDILVNDHAEVDALLRGLWDAFEGGEAEEVLAKLDYLWARLAVHIRAEHLHLFPALLAAAGSGPGRPGAPASGEVRESVERLREDHDFFMRELAGAVGETRALAAESVPPDGARLRQVKERVTAVASRLAEHNRLEEEQVYLWPSSLLGEEALSGLVAAMKREVENIPPRFSERAPDA
jgi:hypothetical protein